jgi:small-conductance mechanosensitive channel
MELRQNISNVINQSELTADAIYFVLKDILSEVAEIYNQQVRINEATAQQSQKSIKEEKNNEIQEAVAIDKTEEE